MSRIPLLVAIAALPSLASADTLAERVLACAGESSAVARLDCYDRVAATLPGETDAPPAAPAVPPVTSAPAPAAAPPPRAAVDEFGMNVDLEEALPEESRRPELDSIRATVTDIAKRPRGERLFTLDNGQVWTETSTERGARVDVGDEVEVRKGALSGYRLVGRGNRSSRVRRLR